VSEFNLANPETLKKLLAQNGFSFNKSLGQNFLVDETVCPNMAQAASNDCVLEIGPGVGVLTKELCETAKKVIAIELDERLKPILNKTLGAYDNVKVIFADAMKIDLEKLILEEFGDTKVAVCANLPYYITSPLIMRLLESHLPISSLTVMVQQEAAERLCAEVGTRAAGAVSVAVSYHTKPQILFEVPRDSFMPAPKVDSAVIQLVLRDKPQVEVKSEKAFFALIKAAFAMRRKTFVNSVSASLSIPKPQIISVLEAQTINPLIRAEALTMAQLGAISDALEG